MTILHVETGRHWLGGPAQVLDTAIGQQKRGHRVFILCPDASAISRRAASAGLPVRTFGFAGDLDPRLFFATVAAIGAVRPDIVHLHSRRGADTQGAWAAKMMGQRVVLSRRVDYPLRASASVRWRYRHTYDHIIAISDAIRRVMVAGGVPEDRVTTVHDSVDASVYRPDPDLAARSREELGVPAGSPFFAIVAHMIRRKGHDVLFRAVARLAPAHPEIRLGIFGRGEEEPRLRQLASSLGIEGQLIWAGFREDLPNILPGIDCLVHPARLEGLGVAILQALACGKPVIACPVGGIPEAVRPPSDGWLVPVDDDAALAAAMAECLEDPAAAEAKGAVGRSLMLREFGVECMVERNLAIYEQVLKGRK